MKKNGTAKNWILSIAIMIFWSAVTVQAGSGELSDIKEQLTDLQERTTKLEENKDSKEFKVFWKEGLNLTSVDESFKLKMGGRLMNDWLFSSEDESVKASSIGEQEDGVEFRRARLYFSGSIYDNVKYKFQLDFEGGDADFKDAYVAFTDFPLGTVQIGHFKEPFSLEELTSSKYITFLERSLPNAFVPSRNMGVMLHHVCANERMTTAIGLFRNTDNYGEDVGDGGYNVTGRITALPIYEDKGAKLLHVGAAYSHRNYDENIYGFAASPEAHLADYFVNTGTIAGDRVNLLGLEAAWVCGPFSLQSEYIMADGSRFSGSDVSFDSYYVQASYFLTGEHRSYKASEAAFSRVKPKTNYKYGSGPGAWEAKIRFSELDLNDGNVTGGELTDITAGLNWYLNPNTKIMWDYIHADEDTAGQADMLMMRLQFDF